MYSAENIMKTPLVSIVGGILVLEVTPLLDIRNQTAELVEELILSALGGFFRRR